MTEHICGVPLMGEWLRDLPPVIAHFLDAHGSPYQSWFETDSHGELLRDKTLQAFVEASSHEMLAPFMPLMAKTPKREGTPPHHATGSPGAAYLFGGRGRNLNPNADLICPIWFGDHVRVRLAAKLIGPMLVGERVRISANTGVIRSIIGPRTYIDDGANLKDTIVGSDCYIGVGAKLLSKQAARDNGDPIRFYGWHKRPGRLIPQRVSVTIPRSKMGCVVGDGCRIGAGTTLLPGTIILPGTMVPEDTTHLPVGIYAQEEIDRFLKGR